MCLFVVEKSSKYYLVKNILLALFEIIDSQDLPPNSKRRLSYFTGSTHLYDSAYSHGLESSDVSSSPSSTPPSPTTLTTIKEPQLPNGNNTSYFSSSRLSPPAEIHGDDIPESASELVEQITRCLRKCGEEEEFLPLFKVVFTTLADVPDNRTTRRLDVRARDILLTGVITRMIRYVSEHTSLVFISDDVQCK